MVLLDNLQNFLEREKNYFLEDIKAFVQEHRDAYERYIHSSDFENDIDEWTKSFSTKYYSDQNYESELDREERIKLKLQHLTKKIKTATAEGGMRGAKITIPSMNLKIILGGAATGAMGQLLFSLRYGGTVLLKKFVMHLVKRK